MGESIGTEAPSASSVSAASPCASDVPTAGSWMRPSGPTSLCAKSLMPTVTVSPPSIRTQVWPGWKNRLAGTWKNPAS